jgi:anti-sigma factor ChrR (cupin superfamily)
MQHQAINDELRAQAALYSLGVLEPELCGAFEQHIKACAVCRAEVRAFHEIGAQLALSAAMEPPAHLRDRVLEAIQDAPDDILIVRANERGWVDTPFRGVRVKALYEDPQSRLVTQLVRLAPGARYPSHRHAAPEQCYVVEGDVKIGGDVFSAGDFSLASAHSLHGEVSSVHGCLLVIVASPDNEVYA